MASKLKKENVKQGESTGRQICRNFLEYLTVFLASLLVLILPLALKEGYYKVGDFKFQIYFYLMNGGMAVLLPLWLVWLVMGIRDFKISLFLKELSATDRIVLLYLLATLLSFFMNPAYMKANFMGYSGWFMGLYAQLTFGFLYFFISRFAKDYRIVLVLLAGSSVIAYVFGILHRLLIDPLHTYDGLDPYYYIFLSTLGQPTWYSSFLCTFLPFGMGLYLITEKKLWRILSALFCITGFTTLVSQNSDSAYLAMAAALLILLYHAVESADRVCRLLEILVFLLLSGKLMALLWYLHPNEYRKLDQFSDLLIYHKATWLILGLLVLLWVVFFVLGRKQRYHRPAMVILRNILYILVALSVIVIVATLVLGAKGRFSQETMEKLSRVSYLVWSDSWGMSRGFTWRVTWQMIREFALPVLLLGVGPDGFARYGYEHYNELIRSKWGDIALVNAHNEWLNMVVNGGIIGALLYAGIFLSLLHRLLREARKNPYLICFAACIGGYMGHNLTCYQQICCTPFIFLIMGCGEWELRRMRIGEKDLKKS